MAAETTANNIITQALAVADEKAAAAQAYADQAATAAGGTASLDVFPISFTPGDVEPPVNIPFEATGLDTALYDSTYDRIMGDLTDKLAEFIGLYFPNECDYWGKAQNWLCDTLTNGGTGMNASVEDQIWQRDRSRILREGARLEDDAMAAWAARGWPQPPGALAHQVSEYQIATQQQVSEASRNTAIKQAEIEIENVRFAVKEALDLRVRAVSAVGDLLRTLVSGPEIAARLATSAADAQARLISAASTYYDARIELEKIKLSVLTYNSSLQANAGEANLREFSNRLRARTDTLSAAARAMGDQAAAALTALHASAQLMIQEEAA